LCKVAKATGWRKRLGLKYIFFDPSAFLSSGTVIRLTLCI
jgi:hypothetical protein